MFYLVTVLNSVNVVENESILWIIKLIERVYSLAGLDGLWCNLEYLITTSDAILQFSWTVLLAYVLYSFVFINELGCTENYKF